MDEMDLVRAFRNEAREPDESSVRTARNALLERAGLGNHMAVVPTQPRRSHRHWAIPVVAVAVTGALAIVILIPVGRGSPSAAARVLIRASETAAEQRPLTVVGKGKYAYTKAEGMFAMSNQDFHIDGPVEDPLWAVLVPYTREVWVGADGSGRVVITHGDPEFLRPQDRLAWVATGSPDLRVPVSDETLGRGELHYFGPGGTTDLDVSTLPTDSAELRNALDELGWAPGDLGMFELAAFLLTESGAYVRPELRAALYRMVADMPDIELLGEVDDEVGRAGIGVGYRVPTSAGFSLGAVEGFPSGPMRHEVIFDPATSVVLGERYVYTGSGTAVSWVVYLESGVVDGPSKDI